MEGYVAERGLDLKNQPRLQVGTLPDTMPSGMRLPDEAEVLGSVLHHDRTTIVATTAQAPEDVIVGYVPTLKAQGWREVQKPGQRPDQGFQSHQNRQRAFAYLCRDSTSLRVSAAPRAGGRAYLDVHYEKETGYLPPCQEPQNARRRARIGRMEASFGPMPSLRPPEGVDRVRPSGMGGSSNGAEARARVETTLSAAELVTRYGEQIEAAGWTPRSKSAAEDHATQTWTLEGENGQRWRGVFTAVQLSDTSLQVAFDITRLGATG
jgi:hypothetical protein